MAHYILGDGPHAEEVYDLVRSHVTDNIIKLSVADEESALKEAEKDGVCFYLGVGNCEKRMALLDKFKRGFFPVVTHDYCWRGRNIKVCKGALIFYGAYIGNYAEIDYGCLINIRSLVGHNSKIGYCTVLAPNVTILGGVDIGGNCYIGAGSVIRDGVKIGDGCRIAPGSVVISDIKPCMMVSGNPAVSTGYASYKV